jgi:uncharacterized membrane protein YoaK (UPF0700 family)
MISLRKIDTDSGGVPAQGVPAAVDRRSTSQSETSALPSALVVYSALLSGVAGYVDAAGFVLLLGVFPAHLTGELVSDAIALSSGQLGERAARLWIFPVFFVAIGVAALVARLLHQRGRKVATGLLVLVTVSLALFSLTDALAHLLHESHLPTLVGGSCAVAAMGFQTVLMRESLTACPTTVMTGNLAHVVTELVEHVISGIFRRPAQVAASRSRLAAVASALFAFGSSAALGSSLARAYGSLSVLLPALVTGALAARNLRRERPATPSVVAHADLLPWFTEDELWPDSKTPQALSPPYTEASSGTRIKAERVLASDSEPPLPRRA